MTKKLPLLLFVFISFYANAQIKKGTVLLGGQIASGSFKRENSNSNSFPQPIPTNRKEVSRSFTIGISAGKTIKENTVIGFIFNTGNDKQTVNYSPTEFFTQKSSYNETGLFLRKYKKLAKEFYIYGQGNALVNFGKSSSSFTNPTNNSSSTQTGGTISFAPGIAYAFSKKLHLELSMQSLLTVQYFNSKINYTNPLISSSKTSGYNFNTSLSSGALSNISIGFRFLF